MDKLNALKIFCTVAETLHFKEAANRLGISPQVISRMINQLEQHLGEKLFQRNTRQVQLTDFGDQILAKAKLIVQSSEQLFAINPQHQLHEIAGIVRLTVPDAPIMYQLLPQLLQQLNLYPKLHLDWRMEMKLVDKIAERIDIGIRMGDPPTENNLVVKKVASFHEKIVASPELLQRLGKPKDLSDLVQSYPLVGFINQSEKVWDWQLNSQQIMRPDQFHFISNNLASHLSAALAGHSVALLHHTACKPYLQQGALVELFSDLPHQQWGVYLYRPYAHTVPARIQLVFNLLQTIIQQLLPDN